MNLGGGGCSDYEDEQAFTEAAAEHSAQMEAFFGTPGKANTAMPGRKRK